MARAKADGSAVYDAFFTFIDPATGAARRSCKRGFPTSAAAGRYLRAQTTRVDAGSYVPPSRLILADYLEQWLDGLRLAPQTVGNYRVWVQTHPAPWAPGRSSAAGRHIGGLGKSFVQVRGLPGCPEGSFL